jgi:peroxiredoxin
MPTESTRDLALGAAAPAFALPDTVSGRTIRLTDYAASRALLVSFICNHCPYVIHLRDGFVQFARHYQPLGVAVVAISSNDPAAYPQDGPDAMKRQAQESGFTFPYLFDQTQQTARDYHAVCTPEFYLFDSHHRLAYHGRFDASRPGNGVPVTGSDLRGAVDALLAQRPVGTDQKPGVGCSIKWKVAGAGAA